jgi:hypothetical protein
MTLCVMLRHNRDEVTESVLRQHSVHDLAIIVVAYLRTQGRREKRKTHFHKDEARVGTNAEIP